MLSHGVAEVGLVGWFWRTSAVGLLVSAKPVDWEALGLEIFAEEVAECVGVVHQKVCAFEISAPALLVGVEFEVVEAWYFEAVLAVKLPLGGEVEAVEAVEA